MRDAPRSSPVATPSPAVGVTSDIFGSKSPAATASGLRDTALTQVLGNAGAQWKAKARLMLTLFALERADFIAEEFRVWALGRGCPEPHHHNAWGALVKVVGEELTVIEITDHQRPMMTHKSHGRRSPVWKSLIFMPQVQPLAA